MADALILGRQARPSPSRSSTPPSPSSPRSPTRSRSSRPGPSTLAGKMDEAKAVLDEILKRDPDHPEAKAARGEIK